MEKEHFLRGNIPSFNGIESITAVWKAVISPAMIMKKE
jgi:hypothetical protein